MSLELDFYEYPSDAAAQAAYPTSKATDDFFEETQLVRNNEGAVYGDGGDYEEQGQEFQVSNTITCVRADISVKKYGSPTDNITCRIETDNAGLPSGTLVHAYATKTLAASGLPTSFTLTEFLFNPFTLNASTPYHIVLVRSGARDTSNYIGIGAAGNEYANGELEKLNNGTWENQGSYDMTFRIVRRDTVLQCYSESSIKQQGSYSLKGFADQTNSLNETLTRTIGSPINLSGVQTLKFDIRASRTGSNIKIGIHDSGGTTTEKTHAVSGANSWETVTWDISGVANANKDAIDKIIVTIVNADADNTFYLDNFYAEVLVNTLFFGSNF